MWVLCTLSMSSRSHGGPNQICCSGRPAFTVSGARETEPFFLLYQFGEVGPGCQKQCGKREEREPRFQLDSAGKLYYYSNWYAELLYVETWKLYYRDRIF